MSSGERGATAAGPHAAVISVGDELLLGRTVDTNAAWLGRRLAELGLPVAVGFTVGDEAGAIRTALSRALEVAEAVVVTGGLGPTPDDRTREAVCQHLGLELTTDPELRRALVRQFRELGHDELPAANESQARVPEGATVVRNPHGTAPGLVVPVGDRRVVLLPGVPKELRGIFEGGAADLLRDAFEGRLRPRFHRTLHTTGIAESVLAERVGEALEPAEGPVEVAFLPRVTGVDLRLTARDVADPDVAGEWLDRTEERLRIVVEPYRYRSEHGDLVDPVAEALVASGRTVATAESCTGGLLAKRLTDRPGSSAYFLGGVVSYSDDSKLRDLGVPAELIRRDGAVSEGVARAMAEGVARRFGADSGVSITGIAGPSGGSPEKPVGTVWYAATVDGRTRVRHRRLPGDRSDVRERSAQAALHLLLRMLEGSPEARHGAAAAVDREEP